MTGVFKVACITGIVIVAVGLVNLWAAGLFGTHLGQALLGLTGGPVLVLGVYAISLRLRITALEARLSGGKPADPQ